MTHLTRDAADSDMLPIPVQKRSFSSTFIATPVCTVNTEMCSEQQKE